MQHELLPKHSHCITSQVLRLDKREFRCYIRCAAMQHSVANAQHSHNEKRMKQDEKQDEEVMIREYHMCTCGHSKLIHLAGCMKCKCESFQYVYTRVDKEDVEV